MKFEQLYTLIRESKNYSQDRIDSHFRKQFIGAISIVFDIDYDDIVDDDKIILSYGNKIGLNSLDIGSYWFHPETAHTKVKCNFFINYKTNLYQIKIDILNWNNPPSEKDLEMSNKGQSKSVISRKPINFSLPMTSTGHVDLIETNFLTDDEEAITIGSVHNYPDHFNFTSLDQLASKIKSIIDGYGRKNRDKVPDKPQPIIKSPKSPKSPKLVLA